MDLLSIFTAESSVTCHSYPNVKCKWDASPGIGEKANHNLSAFVVPKGINRVSGTVRCELHDGDKKMKRLLMVFIVLFATNCFAQEPLTNESVVRLIKGGLSDEIVISMIKSQPAKYNLGTDQILALKKESVSDKILAAMIERASGAPGIAPGVVIGGAARPTGATPAAGTEAAGDPNDPMTPHDSGIYLYTRDRTGNPQMTMLEPAAYQGSKTGGILSSSLTYGIKKAKMKAVIPGPHASIRTSDPQPVFYFYFEDKAAGLGKSPWATGGGVSSPNQFVLVNVESKEKNRETIIAEFGALGASSGTHEKSMTAFKSEKLRTGLYKVTPAGDMKPGEYCFMVSSAGMGAYGAGAAGAAQIFDFGITSGQ